MITKPWNLNFTGRHSTASVKQCIHINITTGTAPARTDTGTSAHKAIP
jgi:hypothetical protein